MKLSTTEQDILILFSFWTALLFITGSIASLAVKVYQKVFSK